MSPQRVSAQDQGIRYSSVRLHVHSVDSAPSLLVQVVGAAEGEAEIAVCICRLIPSD